MPGESGAAWESARAARARARELRERSVEARVHNVVLQAEHLLIKQTPLDAQLRRLLLDGEALDRQ